MTTRRRRDRVRIRTHGDIATQETVRKKPKPSTSRVGTSDYAKARAKVPVKNANGHFTGDMSEPEPEVQESSVAAEDKPPEIPQPNERALNSKDLISIDEIMKNPVLTPDEVGVLLRVSPDTVLRLCREGEIPSMRIKRETRMLRIDVLKFMRDLRERQNNARRWKADNPRYNKDSPERAAK